MRMSVLGLMSLFLFSSLSFADNFELDEIPPLRPLKLFVSKLDPKLSLLWAKESKGGKHYLVISDNGKIYSPKLTPKSYTYYNGGSADFYLESGERVFLPSNSKDNYLNTTMGPSIIYSHQAPTPLKELDSSDQRLQKFDFSQFIDTNLEAEKPYVWKAGENYQFLKSPESRVLVTLEFEQGMDYKIEKQIEDKLKALDKDKVYFLERGGPISFAAPNMVMLASVDSLELIKEQIPAGVNPKLDVLDINELKLIKGRKLTSDEFLSVMGDFNDQTTSLKTRIQQLALLSANTPLLSFLSEKEKIELMQTTLHTLGDLDRAHTFIGSLAMVETAVNEYNKGAGILTSPVGSIENARKAETHPVRPLMLDPMREIGVMGYKFIDKIDHPIAREIIVETSMTLHGAGIPLLFGQPTGVNHSYFREWLNQQRVHLALIDKLPKEPSFEPLDALNLRTSSHSGGVFQHIKVSGELTSLISMEQKPVYFTDKEETRHLPMILFGFPVKKEALKHELVQYIIEADKKAEQLSNWSRAATEKAYPRRPGDIDPDFHAEGDDRLSSFIVRLPYIPGIAKYALSGFSKTEYLRNVSEVLQQLLEISEISLINNGTYVSILEASAAIIKEIEIEYGLNSDKEKELSKAAVNLQRTVHQRLMKGLSWMSHSSANAKACKVLLSPTPWKTMRKLDGH